MEPMYQFLLMSLCTLSSTVTSRRHSSVSAVRLCLLSGVLWGDGEFELIAGNGGDRILGGGGSKEGQPRYAVGGYGAR